MIRVQINFNQLMKYCFVEFIIAAGQNEKDVPKVAEPIRT